MAITDGIGLNTRQKSIARSLAILARVPWSVVLPAVLLVAAGWLGIARSQQLAETGSRLLRQQMVWSVLGLVVMAAVATPNYRILLRYSYLAFGVTLLLLVAVYFFPPINGARRWIRVGSLSLQPSELAKVAYVLAVSRYLIYRENYRRAVGLLAPLGITLVPVLLILREPDLGTALVFLPVLLLMLFAAGARRRDLALVVMAGVVMLPVLWMQMSREQRSRITALAHQTTPEERPSTDGFHLHHAKKRLALGGWWGSYSAGDAVDDETAYDVPEAATDSIFVVLGERFGLVGIGLLLSLYVFLAWRGLALAAATREPFGRLVATGLVILLSVQVVINTAMMVGLLPITGLSLPLVSYGGSGLISHAIALGLLVNIGMRPGYEVTNEPFRFVG